MLVALLSIPVFDILATNYDVKIKGLIAYVMFYKIFKFESLTIVNDVIMTSLPKTVGKFGILLQPS